MIRTRRRLLTAAMAVAAVAALALAAPASASSGGPVPGTPANVHFTGNTQRVHIIHVPVHTHLPSGLRFTGHTARNITLVQSRNWSGYADLTCGTCQLRFVNANFAAPSINCTGVTTNGVVASSFWAGLDGFVSNTVEQVGVDAYCNTSTPVYFAWFEMFPLPPVQFTIAGFGAGDAVNVSVYYDGSARLYHIAFNDYTQGVFATTAQPCPAGSSCQNNSAEVIGEAPFNTALNEFTPLADFGRVFYNGATVTLRDGAHGNLGDEPLWSSFRINMVNGAHVLAAPGSLLNGLNGTIPVSDFTDGWQASL